MSTMQTQLFLSTPSARRATMQYPCVLMISGNFYPRPPRGGRRPIFREHPPEHDISIHALREEGDDFFISFATSSTDFYPRPPRGGRLRYCHPPSARWHFYPRPPRGGRLRNAVVFSRPVDFYPRPPRGGRQRLIPYSSAVAIFLSTPSARRATEAS